MAHISNLIIGKKGVKGKTHKNRNILKTVRLISLVRHRRFVLENKRNLNDPRQTGAHQTIPKHLVRHGANHEFLRVRRHGPARHQQDKARDKVSLGRAVPVLAQPNTSETSSPPDDPHGGVLPIVADPGRAPAVFGKSVDAAPGGNNGAVEEFLATAGAAQPQLTDQKNDSQENTVGDKGAAHDKVSEALAEMVALAEAESGDAAKHHLDPGGEREGLPVDAVEDAKEGADAALEALFEVQLQVDAEDDLGEHHKKQNVGEAGVDIVGDELSALVQVAECVSEEGEGGREDLERDVPAAFDDLLGLPVSFCSAPCLVYVPGMLTPNTMPVGNRIPKTNVCRKM